VSVCFRLWDRDICRADDRCPGCDMPRHPSNRLI
jgi:hypothetical protein